GNPDAKDPATKLCTPPPGNDYRQFLRLAGLQGKRIGIPRANYYDPIVLPGRTTPSGGLNAAQAAVLADVINVLKARGATAGEPPNTPRGVGGTVEKIFLLSAPCRGGKTADATSNCSVDLEYGFKRDFNALLATFGSATPVHTLTELITFNNLNI